MQPTPFESWSAENQQRNPLYPLSAVGTDLGTEWAATLVHALAPGKGQVPAALPPLFTASDAAFPAADEHLLSMSCGVPAFLVCSTESGMYVLYDLGTGERALEMHPELDSPLLGGIAYAVQKKSKPRVVFMAAHSSATLCCYYYREKTLEQQQIRANALGLEDVFHVQCLPVADASADSAAEVLDASRGASKDHQQFSLLVADKAGNVVRLSLVTKTSSFSVVRVHETANAATFVQLRTLAVPFTIDTLDPFRESTTEYTVLVFVCLSDRVVIKACGAVPQVVLTVEVLAGDLVPSGLVHAAVTNIVLPSAGTNQPTHSLCLLLASRQEVRAVSLARPLSRSKIALNIIAFTLDCAAKLQTTGVHAAVFLEPGLAVLCCEQAWYVVILATPVETMLNQPAVTTMAIHQVSSHGPSAAVHILNIVEPAYSVAPANCTHLLCKPRSASSSAAILTRNTLDILCLEHASQQSQHRALPLLYYQAYQALGPSIARTDVLTNGPTTSFDPLVLSACLFMHESNHRLITWKKHLTGVLQTVSASEQKLAAIDMLARSLLMLYEGPFASDAHGYVVSANVLAIAESAGMFSKIVNSIQALLTKDGVVDLPAYFSGALLFLASNFQLSLAPDTVRTILGIVSAHVHSSKADGFVYPLLRDSKFALHGASDEATLETLQSLCLLNSCDRKNYDDFISLALEFQLEDALYLLYTLRLLDQCKATSADVILHSDMFTKFFEELRRHGSTNSQTGVKAYQRFLHTVLSDFSDSAYCAQMKNISHKLSSGHALHMPAYLAGEFVVVDLGRTEAASANLRKVLHGNLFTGNPNSLILEWITIDCSSLYKLSVLCVASKAAQLVRKAKTLTANQVLELNHVLITLQNLVFDAEFIKNLQNVDSIDNPQIFKRLVTTGRLDFTGLLILSHALFDVAVIILDTLQYVTPGSPVSDKTLTELDILPGVDTVSACKTLSRLPECCWVYLLLTRAMNTPAQLESYLLDNGPNNVFTRAFSNQHSREQYSRAAILSHFPMYFMLRYLDLRSPRLAFIYSFLFYVPWYIPLDLAAIYSILTDILQVPVSMESSMAKPADIHLAPVATTVSAFMDSKATRPAVFAMALSLARNDAPASNDDFAKHALSLIFMRLHDINMLVFTNMQRFLAINPAAPIDNFMFRIVKIVSAVLGADQSGSSNLAASPTKSSVHLTKLLQGINYQSVHEFIENPAGFALQMLELFRHSPYTLVKAYFSKHLPIVQAMEGNSPEEAALKEAYMSMGTWLLCCLLFPDDLVTNTKTVTQLNGRIRRNCSKISGKDIAGPELLLFGTNEDGFPLHEWFRFTDGGGSLTQEQKSVVYSTLQFLICNCAKSSVVKDGSQKVLGWTMYLLPLMDSTIAKRLVDEAIVKSTLDSETQFLLSLQLSQFCGAGSISAHIHKRFRALLENHETSRAELDTFINRTLALYLSQIKTPDKTLLSEIFDALNVVQGDKEYLELATKTLSVVKEAMYVDETDLLSLHIMQLEGVPRAKTLLLIRVLADQLNSDLITRTAILNSGITDQSHSLNMRLTLLRQGTTLGKLTCSICQQPVYSGPMHPKPIYTSIEAGKNVFLERHITPQEAKATHVFSCSHVYHHACLNETSESISWRAAVLNRYLMGEVTECEYQAHYEISCPICK